eukprot:15504-Prorocentrum_minimum.AAC.1
MRCLTRQQIARRQEGQGVLDSLGERRKTGEFSEKAALSRWVQERDGAKRARARELAPQVLAPLHARGAQDHPGERAGLLDR